MPTRNNAIPTLKDIAKVAGVSRQAVAAALNFSGTGKVSEALRKRIQKLAQEMHYVPNMSARRLKGNASHTIGIYGVPYASVFSQAFFNALSVELDRHGYNLMANYGMTIEQSYGAMRDLIAKGVDGIIVTTQYNPLAKGDFPAVPSVFCPPARIDGFDVSVDHESGMRLAVEALLAQDCRHFAYVPPYIPAPASIEEQLFDRPNQEKREGIEETLADRGFQLATVTVEEFGGDANCLVERLRGLGIDAVLCSNDYFAGRLMVALLQNGVRVPEEMKVIGYDGMAFCDLCAVPLATVIQPIHQMAQEVTRILLERIQNKSADDAPRGVLLEPYFYPSYSCGVPNPKVSQLPMYSSFSTLEATWDNAH